MILLTFTVFCGTNDSPKPEFETDEDRSYFITRLFVHEGFTGEVNQVNDNFAQKNERSLSEVLSGVLSQKDIDKVKPNFKYIGGKRVYIA